MVNKYDIVESSIAPGLWLIYIDKFFCYFSNSECIYVINHFCGFFFIFFNYYIYIYMLQK